jgi:hypothetical protein
MSTATAEVSPKTTSAATIQCWRLDDEPAELGEDDDLSESRPGAGWSTLGFGSDGTLDPTRFCGLLALRLRFFFPTSLALNVPFGDGLNPFPLGEVKMLEVPEGEEKNVPRLRRK